MGCVNCVKVTCDCCGLYETYTSEENAREHGWTFFDVTGTTRCVCGGCSAQQIAKIEEINPIHDTPVGQELYIYWLGECAKTKRDEIKKKGETKKQNE